MYGPEVRERGSAAARLLLAGVTILLLLPLLSGCGAAAVGSAAGGTGTAPPGPGQEEARPAADLYLEVRVLETGGGSPDRPWSMVPAHLEVPLGKVVAIRLVSPAENRTGHNLYLGPPYNRRTRPVPGGGSTWLVFKADQPGENIPLECGITGHPHLGMTGTLTVRR